MCKWKWTYISLLSYILFGFSPKHHCTSHASVRLRLLGYITNRDANKATTFTHWHPHFLCVLLWLVKCKFLLWLAIICVFDITEHESHIAVWGCSRATQCTHTHMSYFHMTSDMGHMPYKILSFSNWGQHYKMWVSLYLCPIGTFLISVCWQKLI